MVKGFFTGCLGILVGVLLFLVLAIAFFWHEQTIQVERIRVPISHLPPLASGTRVGVISDLHIGSHMNVQQVAAIVKRINAQKPDCILVAGDTLDIDAQPGTEVHSAIQALGQLKAAQGVYLVFGNHDAPRAHIWRPLLEQAGIHVLVNQNVRLRNGVYLIGLGDAFHGMLNAAEAWRNVPEKAAVLVVVHEPDTADRLTKRNFGIQFSGHSHGGQVRLPWKSEMLLPPLGRLYPVGLQQTANGHFIYTTRGLGTSHIPFRLFARPEITIVTLQQPTSTQ